MNNTVDCPYCGHENNIIDALYNGFDIENKFDWECVECEKKFEIYVKFDPIFTVNKIKYINCCKCGLKTRDMYGNNDEFCRMCWLEILRKERLT